VISGAGVLKVSNHVAAIVQPRRRDRGGWTEVGGIEGKSVAVLTGIRRSTSGWQPDDAAAA